MTTLPPLPPSPQKSGFARASLVLGILTPLTCGLTMLPAIICGIVGIVQTDRVRGSVNGRAEAIAGLAIAVISIPLLGIIAALGIPAVVSIREQRAARVCESNAREIAALVLSHARAHDGTLPPDLATALPDDREAGLLHCPSAEDRSVPSYVLALSLVNLDELDDPARTKLIIEDPRNHRGKSVVAYADGHVDWQRQPGSREPPPAED